MKSNHSEMNMPIQWDVTTICKYVCNMKFIWAEISGSKHCFINDMNTKMFLFVFYVLFLSNNSKKWIKEWILLQSETVKGRLEQQHEGKRTDKNIKKKLLISWGQEKSRSHYNHKSSLLTTNHKPSFILCFGYCPLDNMVNPSLLRVSHEFSSHCGERGRTNQTLVTSNQPGTLQTGHPMCPYNPEKSHTPG